MRELKLLNPTQVGDLDQQSNEGVVICGTVTSICVISNALAIKVIEGVEVTVIADCCAGLTKEDHKAAFKVMECCQCNIR